MNGWEPARYIMIAPIGATGQVVTEALDRLLDYGVFPEKIFLITTGFVPQVFGTLDQYERMIKSKISALVNFRLGAEEASNIAHEKLVEVCLVRLDGKNANDIRNADDHRAYMGVVDELVKSRGRTHNPSHEYEPEELHDVRLIMLVSGGRKTMSSGAHSAMTHYGRRCDRILHVLLDPPDIEKDSGFWFRSNQKIRGLENEGISNGTDVKIDVIDVEFLPISHMFGLRDIRIDREKMYSAIEIYRDAIQFIDEDIFVKTHRAAIENGKMKNGFLVTYKGASVFFEDKNRLALFLTLIDKQSRAINGEANHDAIVRIDDVYDVNSDDFKRLEEFSRKLTDMAGSVRSDDDQLVEEVHDCLSQYSNSTIEQIDKCADLQRVLSTIKKLNCSASPFAKLRAANKIGHYYDFKYKSYSTPSNNKNAICRRLALILDESKPDWIQTVSKIRAWISNSSGCIVFHEFSVDSVFDDDPASMTRRGRKPLIGWSVKMRTPKRIVIET